MLGEAIGWQRGMRGRVWCRRNGRGIGRHRRRFVGATTAAEHEHRDGNEESRASRDPRAVHVATGGSRLRSVDSSVISTPSIRSVTWSLYFVAYDDVVRESLVPLNVDHAGAERS